MNSQLNWQFERSPDGTLGQLHDSRCGLWLPLPGSPENLGPQQQGPITFDTLVQLRELPIAVGVRLDRQPAALQPMPMCLTMTRVYAHNRGAQSATINPASAELLTRWGVLGAASALYPLVQPEPSGADTEEVVWLARPGQDATGPVMWLLLLSKLFNSRELDPIRWSMWNAAAMGSLVWDPGLTTRPLPELWPSSTWLQPGFELGLAPQRQEMEARLRQLLTGAGGELTLLQQRLRMLSCGVEPPAQPVDAQMREIFTLYLSDACPTDAARQLLTAALTEVHTAHDLRGLAILGLSAVQDVLQPPAPSP